MGREWGSRRARWVGVGGDLRLGREGRATCGQSARARRVLRRRPPSASLQISPITPNVLHNIQRAHLSPLLLPFLPPTLTPLPPQHKHLQPTGAGPQGPNAFSTLNQCFSQIRDEFNTLQEQCDHLRSQRDEYESKSALFSSFSPSPSPNSSLSFPSHKPGQRTQHHPPIPLRPRNTAQQDSPAV